MLYNTSENLLDSTAVLLPVFLNLQVLTGISTFQYANAYLAKTVQSYERPRLRPSFLLEIE